MAAVALRRVGGVGAGLVVSGALIVWILLTLRGWQYYSTPLAVRGYAASHKLLRPSGPFGQSFGVAGAALLLVPFVYMIRKRLGRRRSANRHLKLWLEVHLFCGIVGPVLITFHTSFKFNGIVSAAYWAMMTVMLSGFVGRYLYVRIPRSLRGTELTRQELDSEAEALHNELIAAPGAEALARDIAEVERAAAPAGRGSVLGLLFGEIGLRRRLRAFAQRVRRRRLSTQQEADLIRLTESRTLLLRRRAYLEHTKRAFNLWHVFHLPLVYLMLVIVTLHVGVVMYLGYVPFQW